MYRLRNLGCAGSIVVCIATPAASQEKNSLADWIPFATDVKNLLEHRDAKLAGTATSAQTEKAVAAWDHLGSTAGGTAAAAAGGRLLGATSAVQASALMPVVQSEGKMLRKLTNSDYRDALIRGDLSAAARAGEQIDRDRAEAGQFKADYGSFTETVKRVIDVTGTPKSPFSRGINQIFSNISKATKGVTTANARSTSNEKPIATCGQMDWFYNNCEHEDVQEEAPTRETSGIGWAIDGDDQCMPAPIEFSHFINEFIIDDI